MIESGAVVLSILAAFAVDAWWDGHQEARREQDLLRGLLDDFRASRPGLESRLTLARRMAEGTDAFLELLDADTSVSIIVPDTLVLAVIGGPTYEPDTNTLDAAVASGEIALLSSSALRAQLAVWRQALVDTMEDEREVRRIVNEQLVPELSRSVNLGPYFARLIIWAGGDPFAAGRRMSGQEGQAADGAVVSASRELVGLLALRKFYGDFSAADLEELLDTLDATVSLLEAELRG